MRLKFVFSLLAVVVMAVLVAGCGGSSDSGSSEAGGTSAGSTDGTTQNATGDSNGPPLTKAEFIKQGDVICEKVPQSYNKKLEAMNVKAEKEKNALVSTAEGNLKAAVPPLYVAAEELEELTPPSADAKEAEAIIDSLEAAAKGVEAKPTSELTGPKSPFAEFQELTKKYGFKFCSQL
ncbi:MAG TPA: hypothetical protein VLL27_09395 [Solirubrobacterales bacterium]|nr:hypothetical protein [Solirubrobacterales bacterium]